MAGRPRKRKGPRGKVAERIRAAREARGISQVVAAAEIGCARQVLASWETGATRPTLRTTARFVELWAAASLGEPIELGGRVLVVQKPGGEA